MAPRRKRYKDLEQSMTMILLADAVLFVAFLFAAGSGIIWLKTATAIIAILLSVLSLGYLFLTGELLKPRSLWLTVGFAAVIVCIVVSLICNYPSPNDLKDAAENWNDFAVGTILLP